MTTEAIDPKAVVAEWIQEAAAEGHTDGYAAKRTNKRYTWYQSFEMLVNGEMSYIECRDIGTGGIGVTTRQRLKEHSEVLIRRDSRDPWIHCRVAHCTQSIGKRVVGLELDFTF